MCGCFVIRYKPSSYKPASVYFSLSLNLLPDSYENLILVLTRVTDRMVRGEVATHMTRQGTLFSLPCYVDNNG